MKHGMAGDPFSCKSVGEYANAATVDHSSKTRSYAATAYYAPISQRTNLSVMTGAQVDKIEFTQADGSMIANIVYFNREGKSFRVRVGKEAILAAGAFQSPENLELSGIGNPQILMPLDIPVVIDNKNVGENLQDHLMTGVSFEASDGVMTGDALMRQEPEAIAAATEMYQKYKAGPMTVGGIASHAFMPMPGSSPVSDIDSELQNLLQQHPSDAKNKRQYYAICQIL